MTNLQCYDGTKFVLAKSIKEFDGTNWVQKVGYEWDGTKWVPFISYAKVYYRTESKIVNVPSEQKSDVSTWNYPISTSDTIFNFYGSLGYQGGVIYKLYDKNIYDLNSDGSLKLMISGLTNLYRGIGKDSQGNYYSLDAVISGTKYATTTIVVSKWDSVGNLVNKSFITPSIDGGGAVQYITVVNDYIYVLSTFNLDKYDLNGTLVWDYSIGSNLSTPTLVVVDSQNNCYIINKSSGIQKVNSDGTDSGLKYAASGTSPNALYSSAICEVTGLIYTQCDDATRAVHLNDLTIKSQLSMTEPQLGGTYTGNSSLDVDSDGNYYRTLAQTGTTSGRIEKFDTNDNLLFFESVDPNSGVHAYEITIGK